MNTENNITVDFAMTSFERQSTNLRNIDISGLLEGVTA